MRSTNVRSPNMGHHLLRRILLALFLCLVLFGNCGCQFSRNNQPQAIQGVLDLTGCNFEQNGRVNLAGEYEFYWHRHLAPGDFATAPPPRPSGFIRVPGYWNGYRVDGQELPGYGYATYRLTILLGKVKGPLAIEVPEVSTAYRLFLDENEAASVGVAGESMEMTVPREYPVLSAFTPASDRVVLLIQVSNFHHRRGGLWPLMTLGQETTLTKLDERKRELDFFLLGGIFIMAVYHLSLFLARRKFRSTLYFGIFCLLIALRLIATDERYLLQTLPALNAWGLLVKMEYLTFYLAVPVFGLFVQSLFAFFSRKLLHLVLLVGLAFSLIVILAPVRVFSHTLPLYEFITLALIFYAFYVMLASPARGHVEPLVFLIGMSLLCFTVINDMLYVEGLINTGYLAPVGLFLFIFSQACILYLRMLKAFTLVETQGMELRDTLESYKQEVLDRIRVEEALRESEEKYRTILNSIEEGYYEVELNGNLTFFNDSLCGILGYTRDEMLGMNNRQFMTEESAKEAYRVFNEVYRTGKPAQARDWEAVAKDGTRMHFETSVSLVRDSKGHPVGFRGIARDITERKRAEAQARLHQEQLFQASKMAALGVLVSGVAHEINNPNNFIMLNAPILRDAWESALPILEEYYKENGDFLMGGIKYSDMRQNIPQLLAGVSQGAERIKQIVANLKHYVRGDSGDLNQAVDVNAVIQSSVSLISNVIKNATDHFQVDYGRDLPPIRGSFQRLEQVIINLLQNACQALPNREKGIFVTTARDREGSSVLVVIRDEGTGIHPEALPRIHEPFYTTKQDSGGIGLGLSISSNIVDEHRGTMRFTSEPGSGTTVTITLPADTRGNPSMNS